MSLIKLVLKLVQRPAACDCGRKVNLVLYNDKPLRVVRRCDGCLKTSIIYPLDQDGGLEDLKCWTLGKA